MAARFIDCLWKCPPRLAARTAARPRERETDIEVKLIIIL
jgi:hypothetical protein